jgi:hypothetical protein
MKHWLRAAGVGGAVLLWGIFFLSAYKNLDPDFGWHLQVGRKLWTEGMPKTDPFSYTMPSWPWVDHGRGSDMGIAWLYDRVGMTGLAVIAATTVILALGVVIPRELWGWAALPLLLGSGVLLTRSGVRPQVEDWVFLAVILKLQERKERWRKWRWLVPAGFAVWANLHGGFGVGLAVIAVNLTAGWWRGESRQIKDAAVLGLSGLATLITPYGIKLWEEIYLTMTDTHLHGAIVEWQPFFTKLDLGFWLLVAILLVILKVKTKRYPVTMWAVLGGLFLAALSSLRNMPFFVLAIIPVIADWIRSVWTEFKNDPEKARRAKIFYAGVTAIGAVVFMIEVGVPIWKITQGRWMVYPEKAVEYLRAEGFEGRLFSVYGWGGYLIWKLPEEKVFIDGRMPSWRWKGPEGESDWAFKEYEKAVSGDFETVFEKYGVGTVLWGTGNADKKTGWLGKLLYEKQPQAKTLTEVLAEKGWVEKYRDETAVVWERP